MKLVNRTREMFQDIVPTMARFPLAFFYFILATALIAYTIEDTATTWEIERFILTSYVGALAAMVAQVAYERFFSTLVSRLSLYGGAVLFSILFHVLVAAEGLEGIPGFVRPALILLGLSVAFVWVPSIKCRIGFHRTLLAGLRAGFLTVLFVIVLLMGVSLLIGAVDQLLVDLPFEAYLHVQNPITSFIGPLLFLMWIPVYPGKWLDKRPPEEQEEAAAEMEKALTPPKSLEWLISYVVIPLMAVFTVILVAYLLLNITGDFWTDNVLEPMLVTYTTLGILVYLLASTLNNRFAQLFLKWYPKVLVPLVLFQTVASFLRMREIGLTHGRYFTLMAGIFTIVAGIIFIIYRSRKNVWVGGLFLGFLVLSITPPVDAFTVSRNYYVRELETTLEQNNMLEGGRISADESIPEADKRTISRAYQYLNRMDGLDEVEGIERSSGSSYDFVDLFGFSPVTEGEDDFGTIPDYREASVAWFSNELTFDVAGFDQFVQFYFDGPADRFLTRPIAFEKEGEGYELVSNDRGELVLQNEAGTPLVAMDMQQTFEEILSRGASSANELSLEEAAVREETEEAVIEVVVLQVFHQEEFPDEYNGEVVIKVGIK